MLNQLARYEPVVALVEEVPGATLLDVGSGHRGIARFLSDRWRITASDIDFTDYGAVEKSDEPGRAERVIADVCDLPFADGEFDVVTAVDLLEHVEPPRRSRALEELARVAARRLIVAVPSGAPALDADRRLAAFYRRIRQPAPGWLEEHLRNGFPEDRELTDALAAHGRLRLVANEWVPAHAFVARVEAIPYVQWVSPLLSLCLDKGLRRDGRRAAPLARSAIRALRAWDRTPSYRTIAVLDRG